MSPDVSRPAVLITDGEQRAALALARSLGRAGFPVYVISSHETSLAGSSRFAAQHARTPDPLADPDGFVAALHPLLRKWNIRCLVPVGEAALLAVLGARDEFQGVTIPFPDLDVFRAICDKKALLQTACALGIAVPSQHVLEQPADALHLDRVAQSYPVVLKPARSVADAASGRIKHGVLHAASPDELQRLLDELPATAYPLLLQQRIDGPGVGVFLLRWRGDTLAVFAHRRLREKPPSGGVSVYRESITVDPALVRMSTDLLERYGWEGVAMVEYKLDAQTGTPYLMEVNGRFWGSLQLAIDAGVDFPVQLVRAALGEPVQALPRYRNGVRSRWWWGDVDQLISRVRHTKEDLALPADAPSRLRSILDFLVIWRPGDRSEVFRWSDPAPAWRESIDWFSELR